MSTSSVKTFLVLAAVVLLTALPARAADLLVKVDKDNKVAVVTNTLPTRVTMLFLVGAENKRRLPLHAILDKGATVKIPLRFAVPESIDFATCEIATPPKGYEKGDDGYYHLSVELQ